MAAQTPEAAWPPSRADALDLAPQAAVVAVTLLGFGAFVATLPLIASVPTPTVVVVPEGTSPEEAARFTQTMRPVMVASLILMAVLFGAAAALIVIGTGRRWRWMFWVVLVLLGLTAFNVLMPLLLRVAGLLPATPPPGVIPSRPPPVPMVVSVVGELALAAAAILFVAMVVAGVRIGPWACQRAAEVAPAAGPCHSSATLAEGRPRG